MALTKVTYSMIEGTPFNVEDYGAKGDGVTDDTAAIKLAIAAIKANNGGTLYFPAGEYYISRVPSSSAIAYRSVFELSSNTHVQFDKGASINFNGVENSGGSPSMGLFGIDWNALPVSNISFSDCVFNQTKPLASGTDQIAAIQFAFQPDTANRSLQNVQINDCNFDYCGIYMVNRLSGSNPALYAERQTHNVIIDGCIATNNASQFVTADIDTCTISNCIVSGPIGDTTESYDGVSVHSGFNINIIDNIFTEIHVGQVINIRDSVENGCGSKNINIIGNTIHNCTATAAIQIATTNDPASGQGVFNVTIDSNTIYGCAGGIAITRAGTGPLGQIAISNNIITANNSGIFCSQPVNRKLNDLSIVGNIVHLISAAENHAIYLRGITFLTVSGNTIASDRSVAGYQLMYVAGVEISSITGNTLYCNAATAGGVLKCGDGPVLTLFDFNFTGNTVACTSSFSDFGLTSNQKIFGNTFTNNPTINGNTVAVLRFSYDGSNTTTASNSAPASGTWAQGDIVYNNNPTSGGYVGWICTVAGTPGTWKTFGLIS